MKNIVLFSILLLFSFISCIKKKEPTYFNEFFRFKLNGQSKAIGSSNSISGGGGLFYCLIQGDTSLLITVGTGETLVFLIKDSKIADATFKLNERNFGGYSTYSPSGILNYGTNANNNGILTIKKSTYLLPAGTIKALDGTFSFKAYDSINNKVVEITDGKFSMEREEF